MYEQTLKRGKLLTNWLYKITCTNSLDCSHNFVSSTAVTTTYTENTIFCWVECWLTFFFLIVWLLLITELSTHFFRFPDYDKKHTEGVTGQQRTPTPPGNLILPLFFVQARFCSVLVMYFSFEVLNLGTLLSPHFIEKYL